MTSAHETDLNTPNIDGKSEPLLPQNGRLDHPILMVISLMTLLTALFLIFGQAANDISERWQTDLDGTANVLIFGGTDMSLDAAVTKAVTILTVQDGVIAATPISGAQTKALLEPWLGDLVLPDDILVPQLIALQLRRKNPPGKPALENALTGQGLEINLQMNNDVAMRGRRAAKMLQRIASLLSLVSLIAISVLCSFATQSSLAAHRKIMRVLTQVGSKNRFIAALFVRRFFKIGLIASLIGTAAAALLAVIIGWMANAILQDGFTVFTPAFWPILIGLPLFTASLCALSAGLICLSTLHNEQDIS